MELELVIISIADYRYKQVKLKSPVSVDRAEIAVRKACGFVEGCGVIVDADGIAMLSGNDLAAGVYLFIGGVKGTRLHAASGKSCTMQYYSALISIVYFFV